MSLPSMAKWFVNQEWYRESIPLSWNQHKFIFSSIMDIWPQAQPIQERRQKVMNTIPAGPAVPHQALLCSFYSTVGLLELSPSPTWWVSGPTGVNWTKTCSDLRFEDFNFTIMKNRHMQRLQKSWEQDKKKNIMSRRRQNYLVGKCKQEQKWKKDLKRLQLMSRMMRQWRETRD